MITLNNNSIIDILKEFGIETERELDAALKKSTFSLGIMAAVADGAPIPFSDMKGETAND